MIRNSNCEQSMLQYCARVCVSECVLGGGGGEEEMEEEERQVVAGVYVGSVYFCKF